VWYLVLLGLVSVALIAALWVAKARGVWGSRRSTKSVEVGAGPYRAQLTAGEEALPLPRSIWVTAAMSAVWGVLTTFLFAPAGGLLLVFLIMGAPDLPRAIAGFAMLAIVASGLGVGVTSIATAFALVRRSEGVARLAQVLSRWSLAHHCAVPMAFAALTIASGDPAIFVWNIPFVWIPCALGAWHATRLDGAHALTSGPVPAPA
jgi:hypothetical protein